MKGNSFSAGSLPSAPLVLSTSSMLVLLQAFRVFIPYLVFEIDQSERQTLAEIALTVFTLTIFGAVLVRLLGTRITLIVAVVALAIGRLGIQLTQDASLRWQLGAVTIVACFWLLIVILPQGGRSIGLGVAIAFLIDLILRALRGTLDLPWMPGIGTHALSVLIVATVAGSTFVLLRKHEFANLEGNWRESLRYAGIGSGVALWLLAAGNLGFGELQGDRQLPGAFILIAVGVLAAILVELFGAFGRVGRLDQRLVAIVSGLLGTLSILVWYRAWEIGASVAVALFAFAVTALTMRCATAAPEPEDSGRWRTGVMLTAGMLVQTAFIFLYFARTGPLEFNFVPLGILLLTALSARRVPSAALPQRGILARAAVMAAIAVLATFAWLLIDEPATSTTDAAAGGLTVMTFNIQEGFSNENVWSLEETARTIEAQDPDIVVLQETTRGWLVMSSVDEVRWLANRLGMDYAYAGNSSDGLWGNAILTRLPIVSTETITYSTTKNLRRSALAIEVETLEGNLLVIDTHLDNPYGATNVRLAQIGELIDFWGGTTPAVIAGDFNADPGSPEWQTMIDAGLVDSGGSTAETTSEDARRIDYIWITPDLQAASYSVPDVWASDHRPVVVVLAPAT